MRDRIVDIGSRRKIAGRDHRGSPGMELFGTWRYHAKTTKWQAQLVARTVSAIIHLLVHSQITVADEQ